MAVETSNQPAATKSLSQGTTDGASAVGNTHSKELEKALILLKTNDDTSRFVGLALLKPVLEGQIGQQNGQREGETAEIIQRSWAALPVKFIDRLLKAKPREGRSKEESESMVGLAVAVLHAFMEILSEPEQDQKFMGRIPLLMSLLRSSPPKASSQIMQILHAIATTRDGSIVLFCADTGSSESDQMPTSYLFVTVLLTDIRSTIPSLQEKLHSADYSEISERLARAYDIISAFIGFLVQSLDSMASDEDESGSGPEFIAPMPVDLLLKLRTNISEVISLTIEHLRDRYDSSSAGAAGLHPSARSPVESSASSPLPIAWETSSAMGKDPLTLSQLRALSLWLRDEENEALRAEASGIVDFLMAMYQDVNGDGFKVPVLLALQGIIQSYQGSEAFLRENGWMVLATDLTQIMFEAPEEHPRGIEIVRVLLGAVEADTGPAKEEWTPLIGLARDSMAESAHEATLELPIAISQLAVELLVRAPLGIRRENQASATILLKRTKSLLMNDKHADVGIREGLEEVVEGLETLGCSESARKIWP